MSIREPKAILIKFISASLRIFQTPKDEAFHSHEFLQIQRVQTQGLLQQLNYKTRGYGVMTHLEFEVFHLTFAIEGKAYPKRIPHGSKDSIQ